MQAFFCSCHLKDVLDNMFLFQLLCKWMWHFLRKLSSCWICLYWFCSNVSVCLSSHSPLASFSSRSMLGALSCLYFAPERSFIYVVYALIDSDTKLYNTLCITWTFFSWRVWSILVYWFIYIATGQSSVQYCDNFWATLLTDKCDIACWQMRHYLLTNATLLADKCNITYWNTPKLLSLCKDWEDWRACRKLA